MNTDNGHIYSEENMKKLFGDLIEAKPPNFIEMLVEPTKKQMNRKPYPKVGRNEPCPCNSGKKFKKCCLTGV